MMLDVFAVSTSSCIIIIFGLTPNCLLALHVYHQHGHDRTYICYPICYACVFCLHLLLRHQFALQCQRVGDSLPHAFVTVYTYILLENVVFLLRRWMCS